MKDEFLDYIIFLENTLAAFYKKIKVMEEYERAEDILELMETHSVLHAQLVENLRDENPRPEIKDYFPIDYQNTIVHKVAERIKNEGDLPEVIKILAESEESVGVHYGKLSDYLRKLSAHYLALSEKIDDLSGDEMNHRDLLLKDLEKLKTGKKT